MAIRTGRITNPTTAMTRATNTTGHHPSIAIPGKIQPANANPTLLTSSATPPRTTSERWNPEDSNLPIAPPRLDGAIDQGAAGPQVGRPQLIVQFSVRQSVLTSP